MATLSCAVDSACPTPYPITAAQTTVPMITLSLPDIRRREAFTSFSSATEGLQQRGPFGVGEVGADQPAVPQVEPLPKAVEVGVLGDQEQGRVAGADLRPDPLEVVLGDAGPGGGLGESADPCSEHDS